MLDFNNMDKNLKIHMIGIGGISMSGIAIMLKEFGFQVSGSDITSNDMVEILKTHNINVFIGNDGKNVSNKDIVVYTSAIDKTSDKEYLKAKELKIPTYERAPFLGALLKGYEKPICISGMHGKTTSTSMIATIFKGINLQPTVLVGSKLNELNNLNYLIGNKEWFILEACEYVDSFLNFGSQTSVVLNIEADHLDYFKDIDNIKDSFKKFIYLTHENGNLIICNDSICCNEILEEIMPYVKEKNINLYTFSISNEDSNFYAGNISLNENSCYSFDLYINQSFLQRVNLKVPGKHNVLNALASLLVSFANNISMSDSIVELEKFKGASRRFEFKKELPNGAKIFDDYAHHPTEIKTSILSAKDKNPKRIIAIFEPHTYSRTLKLFNEFIKCFEGADLVILTRIYAAREKDNNEVSSQMLVDAMRKNKTNAIYIEDFDDIAKYIKENSKAGDIVVTIGAGNITKISELL